jgi:hypothetical protein
MKSNKWLVKSSLVVAVMSAQWSIAQEVMPLTAFDLATPIQASSLEAARGGFDYVQNDMQLNGTVANNAATNIRSGNNSISEGAFANASGFPMVIQNSGSNVLIQNATIVNVQFQ